jgi:membrane-associated phospholipid phosphatase
VLAVSLGPTWFGILFLIWAPLVILARVAMGVHYFSDVMAGAFLGILVAVLELFFI